MYKVIQILRDFQFFNPACWQNKRTCGLRIRDSIDPETQLIEIDNLLQLSMEDIPKIGSNGVLNMTFEL